MKFINGLWPTADEKKLLFGLMKNENDHLSCIKPTITFQHCTSNPASDLLAMSTNTVTDHTLGQQVD